MKKVLKYMLWIPFAVSIGSFALYLRYIIMFKLDSNIIVTDQIKNTLNGYLIVAFTSLFIGLVIILFKKIMNLIHNNKTNIIKLESKEEIKENNMDKSFIDAIENRQTVEYKESNFMRDIRNNDIVRIHIDNSNKDMIKNQKKCPKCGNIVDEEAIICTNCGILFDKSILNCFKKQNEVVIKRKSPILNFIINFIVIILCIFLIFLIGNKIINQRNENFNNISTEVAK